MEKLFRTKVTPSDPGFEISYSNPIVSIGSCFAENIGYRLKDNLFSVLSNPSGVVYNPASIYETIKWILDGNALSVDDLIFDGGLYHSMLHHSSFSSSSPQRLIESAERSRSEAVKALDTASTLILTFGSSTCYRYIPTGKIAANCHKIPQKFFDVVSLSPLDVENYITNAINLVRSVNPVINIILTVSPIRYKSYGFHGSNIDKSRLFIGIENAIRNIGSSAVYYFPAYEIQMDELRDYRFYASDMIHPSDEAVDYIYSIFEDTFFSKATKNVAARCAKLKAAVNHRFLTDNIDAREKFNNSIIRDAAALAHDCPAIEKNISDLLQCRNLHLSK